MNHHSPKPLAWHETLEMHELVAFQAIGLMKLKTGLNNVQDPNLQRIYLQTIEGTRSEHKRTPSVLSVGTTPR